MSESSIKNGSVSALLLRTQQGDGEALNSLIDRTSDRLRRLARHMLNSSPAVRRWAGSDDVLQNSLIRLVRALKAVQPSDSRAFFGLAALQMRRELVDQARHFYGPRGLGTNHESGSHEQNTPDASQGAEPPERLAQWAEFHKQIDELDEAQREVVDLLFYQGLSQTEAAEVLDVSVRTVQRRWHDALLVLHDFLQDSDLSVS